MSTTEKTMHPFEANGLGQAPFVYVGCFEKMYSAGPGHSQPAGTCDFCGRGIRYCYQIHSHDGKNFVVGSECVRKLGRADNELLHAIERDIAKRGKERREADRKAKWEARWAATNAVLQSQRDRNGGFTDSELLERKRLEEEARKKEEWKNKNGWLISVLNPQGDFEGSMIDRLLQGPVNGLSDRCVSILVNIYGKRTGGRGGSKKYDAAVEEFYKLAGME